MREIEHFQQVGTKLAGMVLPIYEYAERVQPTAILVCDRDAHPIGVSLEEIRTARDGLASVGDRFFFRRVSKRVSSELLAKHITEPLTVMRETNPDGRLMVVDDYVSNTAGTMHHFRQACRRLGFMPKIDWVTLAGRGTAFNVYPYAGASTCAEWRDRSDVLGIDYDGITMRNTPTDVSEAFYDAIRAGVQQLVDPL